MFIKLLNKHYVFNWKLLLLRYYKVSEVCCQYINKHTRACTPTYNSESVLLSSSVNRSVVREIETC